MIFNIHVDIYKTDVHVIIDETDEKVSKYLKRIVGSEPEFIEMHDKCEAITLKHESGLIFVRFKKDYLISYVSHELMHAVFYILQTRGIEYNEGSEESFTYLLEHLMYNFDKKVKALSDK